MSSSTPGELFPHPPDGTAKRPMKDGESRWQWICASAHEPIVVAKQFLQAVYDAIPIAERSDIRSRIQSGANHGFWGAVLELLLFKWLQDSALSPTRTIHGRLTPDWCIEEAFVVEATALHPEMSRAEAEEELRFLGEWLARRIGPTDWCVDVSCESIGARRPTPREFLQWILGRLNEWKRAGHPLPTDQVDSGGLTYRHGDWSLSVRFRSVPLERRDSTFSTTFSGVYQVTTAAHVVKKLVNNRRKYKDVGYRQIHCIAVPGDFDPLDDDTICEVLFGPLTCSFRRQEGGGFEYSHSFRQGAGIWFKGAGKPEREEPLAIISTSNISLSRLPDLIPTLWENPYSDASKVLPSWPYRRMVPLSDGRFEERLGPRCSSLQHAHPELP